MVSKMASTVNSSTCFRGKRGIWSRLPETTSYLLDSSVAIWAQAISCSNVRGVFAVHERFWFCLVQVSTTQICSFPSFSWQVLMMGPMCLSLLCLVLLRIILFLCIPFVLMATDRTCEDAMHTSLPGSPPLSSNVGSPNCFGHDLDGMGHRSIGAQFKELRNILLPLARRFADFDNHVKTLSEAVGMVTSRIVSVEQTVNALSAKMASFATLEQNVSTLTENVNSLTARICKIETNATTVSSGSDSARSWNILGHSNGSTAAESIGSIGPESIDDSRNTRRRLDTFSNPEDEQARSAVLLRFLCEQYHKGITIWINNLWENPTCQPTTNLSEFIAKQVLCRPDSYSKQEPNVSTFFLWPDIRTMVSHTKLTVPSAAPKQLSRCVNPNELRTGRLESNLRLCGKNWQMSSKLWPDIKKMASLMKLIFHSATSKQSSRPANPSHLKTERSESNVRLCGEC